jgi:hypothetical protein
MSRAVITRVVAARLPAENMIPFATDNAHAVYGSIKWFHCTPSLLLEGTEPDVIVVVQRSLRSATDVS